MREVLIETAGIPFDREPDGELSWGQEAAHSRRRILHVGDGTGQAIVTGLIAALRRCPNVTILTNATAVDLITFPHHSRDPLAAYRPISCHGAYVFDRDERTVHRHLAAATVLATGGLGRIYRNTTNPPGARGDGLAMAHRAGARIVNAEYIQFHPTALAAPGAEGFLISEAVRGEGGVLLSPDGRAFMAEYSPEWKDLAPRDVVARAIHHEMETHGYSHVLLDIASHMPPDAIRGALPEHLRQMPGGRHRHHEGADPGGAGRALFVRRRRGGRMGALQHREPVRRGRGQLHGAARRQPAGIDVAAGRTGVGQPRRAAHRGAA